MARPVTYHIKCPACHKEIVTESVFFWLDFVELVGWCQNCGGKEITLKKTYDEIFAAVHEANRDEEDNGTNGGKPN